jgi:hypothetical protein
MAYADIFAEFPPELRLPVARLVDALRDELGVSRTDFEDLKAVVRELAQAQQRTEARLEELAQAQARTEARLEELAQAQQRSEVRLERLEGAVERLAEAQARTEARVDRLEAAVERLAEAQARTEVRLERLEGAVERLAEAQARTEARVDRLEAAVERLAEAQRRTELRVEELAGAVQSLAEAHRLFQYSFHSQIGGLGARWGLQTEEAFRQGMRTILREVGFTTEQFLDYDAAGEVFGEPDQVELDVVIKNGRVIVVEIKSSLDRANTYLFDRKVAFYTRKTGRHVDRKLIVTPYADNRAKEVGLRLGVEICTDVTALQ